MIQVAEVHAVWRKGKDTNGGSVCSGCLVEREVEGR